jgi:hypothetical protein
MWKHAGDFGMLRQKTEFRTYGLDWTGCSSTTEYRVVTWRHIKSARKVLVERKWLKVQTAPVCMYGALVFFFFAPISGRFNAFL